MNIIISNTMTSKGQVTIPKQFRDMLGLRPGQAVRFEKTADNVVAISRPLTAAEIRAKIGPPTFDQPLTESEKEQLSARGLL